jgi:hypothetical protein
VALEYRTKESGYSRYTRTSMASAKALRVWNQYIVKKLIDIGFKPSMADGNVFYQGRVIYLLYTDDSIAVAPTNKEIDQVLTNLKGAKLDVTDEGKIEDFLGINIERVDDNTYHLSIYNSLIY